MQLFQGLAATNTQLKADREKLQIETQRLKGIIKKLQNKRQSEVLPIAAAPPPTAAAATANAVSAELELWRVRWEAYVGWCGAWVQQALSVGQSNANASAEPVVLPHPHVLLLPASVFEPAHL